MQAAGLVPRPTQVHPWFIRCLREYTATRREGLLAHLDLHAMMMGDVDASSDKGRKGPPAFHALAWVQRGSGRNVVIADLHQECDSFADVIGGIVLIDGVRYVCLAAQAVEQVPPPYHKGQLVELVATEF